MPKWLPDGTRNAMHCDGTEHKTGIHGSATCAMRYEGATGWLVGEPHRGLAAMFLMMNSARLHVGLQGLGHQEMATQNALRYALERAQGRAVSPGRAGSAAAEAVGATARTAPTATDARGASVQAPSADPIALHPASIGSRLDRLDEAIETLREGVQASPRQPVLHYNLACYLSLAGNVQPAIEHLTKAIAIDRRFRDLTQVEPDFDPIRSDPRFVEVTHVAC